MIVMSTGTQPELRTRTLINHETTVPSESGQLVDSDVLITQILISKETLAYNC